MSTSLHRLAHIVVVAATLGACSGESASSEAGADAVATETSGDVSIGGPDAETGDTASPDAADVADSSVTDSSTIDTATPCDTTATDALMAKFVDAMCEPLDTCCKGAGLANDVDKCRARFQIFRVPFIENAVCHGAAIDEAKMDACVTALRNAGAHCREDGTYSVEQQLAICDRAISGVTKQGETCDDWFSCTQPTGPGYARCGIKNYKNGSMACQYVETSEAGGPCHPLDTNETMVPSVLPLCDYDAHLECSAGKCVTLRGLGESCIGASCGADLYCSSGVCVKVQAEGDACSDTTVCGVDLACNAGKCRHLAKLGEACADVTDCVWGAKCDGGKCAPKNYFMSYYSGGTDTCAP